MNTDEEIMRVPSFAALEQRDNSFGNFVIRHSARVGLTWLGWVRPRPTRVACWPRIARITRIKGPQVLIRGIREIRGQRLHVSRVWPTRNPETWNLPQPRPAVHVRARFVHACQPNRSVPEGKRQKRQKCQKRQKLLLFKSSAASTMYWVWKF